MLDLIQELCGFLKENRVRYLIIGGISAVKYGSPRTTYDLDILLRKEDVNEEFLEKLKGEGFEPSEEKTFREFKENTYTVFTKGNREVDLWMRIDGFRFDDEAWKKRTEDKIGNVNVNFISPEDLIASKLALPLTEAEEIDILSVMLAQQKRIDLGYLGDRIKEYNLTDKIKVLEDRIPKISKKDEKIGKRLREIISRLK